METQASWKNSDQGQGGGGEDERDEGEGQERFGGLVRLSKIKERNGLYFYCYAFLKRVFQV